MDEALMPRLRYLTTRAHNAFARAHDIADQRGHAEVTPIHLGIAIMGEKGLPVAALHNLGVPFDSLEREFSQHLPAAGTPRPPAAARSWTAWDQQMIESAREEARELETEFYGTEHLLLALVRDTASVPAQLLAKHGVRYEELRREILQIYHASP